MRISDENIVLCDSTKFKKSSFAKFADLTDVDLIITDGEPGDEFDALFKNIGVDLEYPSKSATGDDNSR